MEKGEYAGYPGDAVGDIIGQYNYGDSTGSGIAVCSQKGAGWPELRNQLKSRGLLETFGEWLTDLQITPLANKLGYNENQFVPGLVESYSVEQFLKLADSSPKCNKVA
jgi:hypothetical protein